MQEAGALLPRAGKTASPPRPPLPLGLLWLLHVDPHGRPAPQAPRGRSVALGNLAPAVTKGSVSRPSPSPFLSLVQQTKIKVSGHQNPEPALLHLRLRRGGFAHEFLLSSSACALRVHCVPFVMGNPCVDIPRPRCSRIWSNVILHVSVKVTVR